MEGIENVRPQQRALQEKSDLEKRLEGSTSTRRVLVLGESRESFSFRLKRALVRAAESGTGTSGPEGLSFSLWEY